jgi:hypothetical protein
LWVAELDGNVDRSERRSGTCRLGKGETTKWRAGSFAVTALVPLIIWQDAIKNPMQRVR